MRAGARYVLARRLLFFLSNMFFPISYSLCRCNVCCDRFQGELFGLGNNYTKFKTKYPNQMPAAQYGQTYTQANATTAQVSVKGLRWNSCALFVLFISCE